MTDREDFRAWFEGPLAAAELALHNGDAGPRRAVWSRNELVSVLDAWRSANGQREVEKLFTFLAEGFSTCTSYALELLAFDVIRDMAYTAALTRAQFCVRGRPTAHLHVARHPGVPTGRRRVEGRASTRRHGEFLRIRPRARPGG